MKTEKNDILTFLLWANFAAFAMHIMDETLMAGGFVPFIQRHFWNGFAWTDFFTANAVWLILIGVSNILYDLLSCQQYSGINFRNGFCILYVVGSLNSK